MTGFDRKDMDRDAWTDAVHRLEPLRAPEGFADRVMARVSREEDRPPAPQRAAAPRRRTGGAGWLPRTNGLWWGWAAAAAGILAVAFWLPSRLQDDGSTLATAGTAARWQPEQAHLVVRPSDPELGAADGARVFEEVVGQHSGQIERRDGLVLGLVPHEELVPFIRSLAERGRFEVSRGPVRVQSPDAWPGALRIRFEGD
ncbi:MAG TPA: hypothetical protein RMG48_16850 [Myxococcales bacterium LLY-WYZ-16_1]|nr:hypothetical protein [Myxococcales bacterium LLY-WYZ-16_1]